MQKLWMVMAMMLCACASRAAITVETPWVRGTVPGQTGSGAFMILKSTTDATIVGAQTPVAGIAEIHEMKLEGGVMKMRAVPRLPLLAGQVLQLKPGGYHMMLMDLKRTLSKGELVPITLRVEGAGKRVETIEVVAEVRDLAASPSEQEHSQRSGQY